jgi:hypothetical protein
VSEAVECTHNLDRVVRSLSGAVKALRLYPPTSPIPAQSVDAAVQAIDEALSTGADQVTLAVEREHFSSDGVAVCPTAPGVHEILGALHEHGVSALRITRGCGAPEVLAFLEALLTPAEDLRGCGGLVEALQAAGVTHIVLAGVHLTVADPFSPSVGEDADAFLRELTRDPSRLAAWFAGAAAGDAQSFEEGLMELVRVSGPSGFAELLEGLASAFLSQDQEAKDALLGLSLDPGPTRDLTGAMFANLTSSDIASSVLGGCLGRNMLSLSSALTRLPLEQVTAEVREQVQAMLPSSGHTSKEAQFLEHMIDARECGTDEPSVVESDRTYAAIVHATALDAAHVSHACEAVTSSNHLLNRASVHTMLALLDQQRDFELYCQGMDHLAAMVAPLLAQQDVDLACLILRELSRRESLDVGPWPELSGHVRAAVASATGPATMAALLDALAADDSLLESAREFVRLIDTEGVSRLVAAALERKESGLEAAQSLLGERRAETLAHQLPSTPWHLLGPATCRLARSGSTEGAQAIAMLMRRPDEQSRREVVNALADVDSVLTIKVLSHALYDPSVEVVLAAARGLGNSRTPGAAEAIATRLDHTDLDTEDFDIVVALIGSLSKLPGPIADDSLAKIASRRGLMKRARHGEIQDLVRRAREYRSQAGDAR